VSHSKETLFVRSFFGRSGSRRALDRVVNLSLYFGTLLGTFSSLEARTGSRAPANNIPSRNLGAHPQAEKLNIDLSSWTLQDKIGQLLIVGYRSPKQIQNLKVGGVVLFAWNLGDTLPQTHSRIQKIKSLASKYLKAPLFIATDQEGGRVLRIREGMTPFPDAAAMGAMQDPYASFQVGKAMGLELSSLGLNMNFAPVLDLGNAKSFLGNRIWGESAEGTGFPSVSFIRGQRAAGIVAVAKHFPGHGTTQVDSHFGLPTIMKTREDLKKEDLEPFRLAIGEGVLALMTAHVEYPLIDKGPASLSKIILKDILRDEMGFKGLVITDDLEMDGVKVKSHNSYGDLALNALQAGSDMIMLIWSRERQLEIENRIKLALKTGEISEEWIDEKVRHVLRVKSQSIGLEHDFHSNPFWRENLRRPESLALAEEVSEKAIRWLAGDRLKMLKNVRGRWAESWEVVLPSNRLKALWLVERPRDVVRVYSPRGYYERQTLEWLKDEGKTKTSQKGVFLVMTPPRQELTDRLFSGMSRELGRLALKSKSSRPVLWIHQGLQPLRVTMKAQDLSLGLLSLNSESDMSLRALQELLKRQ